MKYQFNTRVGRTPVNITRYGRKLYINIIPPACNMRNIAIIDVTEHPELRCVCTQKGKWNETEAQRLARSIFETDTSNLKLTAKGMVAASRAQRESHALHS